ncbi:GntR family transcriptional regulator [Agaricicola taiwanensis]|uniref:GntR family transcriptional regulator n=2 Tax=Agaricicola taiwanensis TaxID=591372 RepID=A0A8J3DW66_9RHOB|nr:GntR family transcriptional regulator [Agaricicola taiwanensis]
MPDRGATRSEHLSQKLEEMILEGTLKPGEKLDEVALAAEFGVSRTPVREAIQRLVAIGLVEPQPRRGPVVTVLPLPKLIGMFELMAEFDILAARLAARRATEEEREHLRDVLERSRKAIDDPIGYTRLNREFHASIYSASHNDYLEALANRTWKQLQPFRNFRLEQPERLRESLSQHEQILEALLAYDADEAAARMRHHVRIGGMIADFVLTMPEAAR